MKPDALTRYLATINRLTAERRKEVEDKKLAYPKKRFWWLDDKATTH